MLKELLAKRKEYAGQEALQECIGADLQFHAARHANHQTDTERAMTTEDKIEAIQKRDARCDGMFVYGVKSTGIVCKPSCKAKVPKVENIELFDTVEQAIEKGYRPCKICMKMKNVINVWRYEAPCGELMLGSFKGKLCLCDWQVEKHRSHVDNRLKRDLKADFVEEKSEVIEQTIRELDEYFAGHRRTFDIPLLFVGTDFQKMVWNELLNIPYGQTISYAELSRRVGRPQSFRAVANANGANSMSIIAPCHRVIGSDHSLTGYGGGIEAKRYLLRLEQGEQTLF